VKHGWAERLAPVRSASETLGQLRSEWARLSGLDSSCRVICGMHDASAGYLAAMQGRTPGKPFVAISGGNWTVVMAGGIDLGRLVEFRDMLANVDIAGQAVGTARFAGGREYRVIAGSDASALPADEAALLPLLRSKAMAIPSFVNSGGAYAGRPGKLIGADALNATGRVALASVYVALMTDLLLDWLDAKGDILLDGSLSDNAIYTQALAALRPQQEVKRSDDRQAILYAGIHLAGYSLNRPMVNVTPAAAVTVDAIGDYRRLWRRQLPRISL
jgi:sugar (pentulose or hexulose) kinase